MKKAILRRTYWKHKKHLKNLTMILKLSLLMTEVLTARLEKWRKLPRNIQRLNVKAI